MRFNILGILYFGFATLSIVFGADEVANGEEALGLIAIVLAWLPYILCSAAWKQLIRINAKHSKAKRSRPDNHEETEERFFCEAKKYPYTAFLTHEPHRRPSQ